MLSYNFNVLRSGIFRLIMQQHDIMICVASEEALHELNNICIMLSLQFGQYTNTRATTFFDLFQSLLKSKSCRVSDVHLFPDQSTATILILFPLDSQTLQKLCQYCNNSTRNFLKSESLSGSSSIAVLNSFASAD